MKIAIPTEDGIMMSSYAINPRGFLVLSVEGGEITAEELRWNKPGDILTQMNGVFCNLADCNTIIVNVATSDLQEWIKSQQVSVVTTNEVIITKVIMQYMDTTLLMESNTCCSP
ncbi:MAG: hypothetical protein WCK34_01940 [Bacteroidota bacterium]